MCETVSLRSRAIAVVPNLPARLAELVPPAAHRCGTSPAIGAARVLAATLRQLRRDASDAVVSLDGGATVLADLDTALGRRIFAFGFCEPAACAMRSLLSPGDLVIDGGANIGLFTVLAAASVGPQGRVVACEPAPATMRLLRANVERNDFGWVSLREAALAAAPGRTSLHVFEPGSGSSSFAPANVASANAVDVDVTTLDDLAGDRLEQTTLVKLDVEGAELRALHGAARLIESARPDFIVELEPEHLERQGSSIGEVQALFVEAGYVGHAIGPGGGLRPLSGAWGRPAGDPNIVVRPSERAAP